jgi:tRNA(Ile)-lysidine synthase
MVPSRKPGPDPVTAALEAFLEQHPGFTHLRVAFSGGRDSTVLLHALAALEYGGKLIPIHVHHGLHPEADIQAAHCLQVASGLGLCCVIRTIKLPDSPDEGLEAAARHLRYQALSEAAGPRDCVLAAHHATDQAETFLLAAMKGSGPAGLAAMPSLRRLGDSWLGRPLLAVAGQAIAAYAERHRLHWVEDPTNLDTRFDRNFIRQELLPGMSRRFPVDDRLGVAAGLQGEVIGVLDGLLDPLLDELSGSSPGTLDLVGFLSHPAERRSWLLRRFIVRCGARAPRRAPLLEFLRQLVEAGAEARPALHWDGFSLRIHRATLYLVRERETVPFATAGETFDWAPGADSLVLPDGTRLSVTQLQAAGIAATDGVQICFRQGGEWMRMPDGRRRTLKAVLQDLGIPPWQRSRVPLVRVRGELVAVLWTH